MPGFDVFVSRWLLRARPVAPAGSSDVLDELSATMADYGALKPADREKRLQHAEGLLAGLSRRVPQAGRTATLERPTGVEPGRTPDAPTQVERGSSSAGTMASHGSHSSAESVAEPSHVEQPPSVYEAGPVAAVLAQPARKAAGVGAATEKQLERLGLRTHEDMLWHLPRRYEDRREVKRIAQLKPGDVVSVSGVVMSVGFYQIKPRLSRVTASLSDGSGGRLELVWFNRQYLRSALKKGMRILVTGKVDLKLRKLQMASPEYEEIGDEPGINSERIVPVYSLTEDLHQRTLRKIMYGVVGRCAPAMHEILPWSVVRGQQLMARPAAFKEIHFPDSFEARDGALERLVFEELFVMQVGLALRRRESERLPRRTDYKMDDEAIREFEAGLPFRLTGAQRRAIGEIASDLGLRAPMSRLIQGDVGSGKTVAAAFAAWAACRAGYQAAIMAPTEILAEQLSRKIQELIGDRFRVRLLKGAMGVREKEEVTSGLALGEIDVAVGTHALIQDGVRFARLAMAIIDEQHKFGVVQRAQLRNKGYNPDVLVMTATPIPRTLALTVFGDLDTSIIDELPPGRTPIQSWWAHGAEVEKAYAHIREQIDAGRQVYVVCPMVDESDKVEAAAATAEAQRYAKLFPTYRVGLLHGRMKPDEKEAVMKQFRQGEHQILVSTTVVEVGVDVPNATVIVIQNADRFGLAQLHQLRGRVGRGAHQSYCVLLAEPQSAEGEERMKIIERTNDGFQIAEEDLRFRGPGDFYGSRQSGLPDLRVADLIRDRRVLERARRAAQELITRDPTLSTQECGQLRLTVLRSFKGQLAQLLS